MSASLGYTIKYHALRDLAEDHAKLGEFNAIQVAPEGTLPALGDTVTLRLLLPGGGHVDLVGKVDRLAEGRGFRVSFDARAKAALSTLAQLVTGQAFQRALAAESPSSRNSREISPFQPPPAVVSSAGLPAPPPAAPPPAAALAADLDDLDADDEEEQIDRYDDYDDESDVDGEEIGTQESDEDLAAPTDFRTPGPGESYVVFVVKFATVRDYVDHVADFATTARMLIPNPGDPVKVGDLAQLRLVLPGRNIFSMYAVVDQVKDVGPMVKVNPESPTFQNASGFPRSLNGKRRLDTERPEQRKPVEVLRFVEERSPDDLDNMPLRRRLQRMSMDDKINLALSGNREQRMALALDGNKAIHHYLLKNARISLDEIAFIARLPTMNPDVLAKIGENPSYMQNQTVVKNLVYNPKTPVPLAIRLLDRLPRSEVLNLSKRMSMNARLVQAAKKKIEGRSR